MHLTKHQFWEFYMHVILMFHHILESFGTWFSPSAGGRNFGKGHLDTTCFNFDKCQNSLSRRLPIHKEAKYIGIPIIIGYTISNTYICQWFIMINSGHVLMSEFCQSRKDGWASFNTLARWKLPTGYSKWQGCGRVSRVHSLLLVIQGWVVLESQT